jgi:hypothetical protein
MLYSGPGRKWEGRWIWDGGDGKTPNEYYLFRKELFVDDPEASARIFITASDRYRLFMNGVFIGGGPPRSQPFYQYYDSYDLGSRLVKGANTIAVEVNYTGTWFEGTRAGLLLECVRQDEVLAKSDDGFRFVKARAWNRALSARHDVNRTLGYQEVYDTRLEPGGWKTNGFDDSRWGYAAVIQGRFGDTPPQVQPWNFLVPREIPFKREEPHLPVKVVEIAECQDSADTVSGNSMGVNISDQLSMDVMKPMEYARVRNAGTLVGEISSSAAFQCSTRHLNQGDYFDRVYDPCIVLDFGRIMPAYLEIDIEGPEGACVDIGYAERLVDGKFVSSFIDVKLADRLYLRKGRLTFRTFCWKSFRYVKLKFRDCFESVGLYAVRAVSSVYPYDYRGSFSCSDDFFNRLWEAGRYTIQICSNDFYMDTPWREQAEWSGDVSAITLGGTYCAFGDVKLPYKFLKESGYALQPIGILSNLVNGFSTNWRDTIPDYSLWWIQAVWNYYMYSGNREIIHGLYPHVNRIVQFFESSRNEAGMLSDLGTWVFIDWADIDRKGECAPLNALFIGTLDYVRKMAELKNDDYMIDYCIKTSEEMKKNFNKRYWCRERGVYVDSLSEGVLSQKVSEHTNMLSILYDIAPEEIKKQLIKEFYEDWSVTVTECGPFFTFFVLCALKKAGRMDIAMDIMKKRWSRMLDNGADSMWEEWGMNGSYRNGEKLFPKYRSLSHAWSAGPVEFLSKWLTGIEIVEPGCGKLRVRPQSGGLESYNVVFPTPSGDVRVANKNGIIRITAPESIQLI